MRYNLSIALLLCLLGMGSAFANDIKDMRSWSSPEGTRVVLDITENAKYSQSYLDKNNQLVIDLKAKSFAKSLDKKELDKNRFSKVHLLKMNDDIVRLTFILKDKTKPKVFSLKPNAQYGHRLVIDFENQKPKIDVEKQAILALFELPQTDVAQPDAASNDKAKEKAKEKADENENNMAQDSVSVDHAKFASKENEQHDKDKGNHKQYEKSESSSWEDEPKYDVAKIDSTHVEKDSKVHKDKPKKHRTRPFVIAIDAGHGGDDPGAIGHKGTQEKEVVLQIAKKLVQQVNKNRRLKAFLIREGDYYVGLKKRTQIARKQHADLFVSIHADAFTDQKAHGASVFVLSKRGASSVAARILAEKENQSDMIGGVSLDDKESLLASVLLDLTQTNSIEVSKEIAQNVLFSMRDVTHLHRGIIEQAGFAVLKSPDIPSILVETGFISNHEGEMNLKNPHYQERLASSIYKGINRYFETKPLPVVKR